MQIYRVGGAVRDKLLGLPVKDQDWVVVGASPEIMKAKGFQPVGKDFPVFLHPQTKEEYALARTERKSGHGYGGFTFHTASDVTLEEDLLRRDLTINAMAEDEAGRIIDPYGGQKDLENRILRHVSEAFAEDPLRILRTARFAARLTPMKFTIADDTLALMTTMVSSGEASFLVAERVWQETRNALMEDNPDQYFIILQQCGALNIVLPELCHSQLNKALTYSNKAAGHKSPDLVRFSCLFISDDAQNHLSESLRTLSKRLRLPSAFVEQARLITDHTQQARQLCAELQAADIMSLFNATDALRRPERFHFFLDALAIAFQEVQLKRDFILECLTHCLQIKAKDLMSETVKGKALGLALEQARVNCISGILKKH
ncbi:hypothetical protein [Endozoicomonas ascidiicola]|uniref:hypothetical protein n=1 Tax=Endozoicomonas ascidiicola TaxID=1698521 RepID=UPI000833B5D1|nr:hypothetical protein [Endozoicomonas ascidiicola]